MSTLTQFQLDGLLSGQYSQLAAVQRHHQRLDDRTDRLDYLQKQYETGQPISVLVLDQTGNIFFRHHSAGASTFVEDLIGRARQLLSDERQAIYKADWPKLPADTSEPIVQLSPLPSNVPSAAAEPADPRTKSDEWMSKQQIADRAGIKLGYVNLYLKRHLFISRPSGIGKCKEYAAPLDFPWPTD